MRGGIPFSPFPVFLVATVQQHTTGGIESKGLLGKEKMSGSMGGGSEESDSPNNSALGKVELDFSSVDRSLAW